MTLVVGRITNTKVSGGNTVIRVNRGKNNGVARGWSGVLLRGGKDGQPLGGSEFKVIKVTSTECVGTVKLSPDQISANKWVQLTAD